MGGASEFDETLTTNLVVAVVSINQWSIARTHEIQTALAKSGLFCLSALRSMSAEDISSHLLAAGYKKSLFVRNLVAGRLHRLAMALDTAAFHQLGNAVRARDTKSVEAQLAPLPGIGPVVLRQFKELQGLR